MKKTLSIILSLILIATSTFCFGISASADDEAISFDSEKRTLTVNVKGGIYQDVIDELENKDKIERVDLGREVDEIGIGAFTSLVNLKKLVVLNSDCKFNNNGVLKTGADVTIYSPDNSETSNAKVHAEEHGYKFLSVYFISFNIMGKATIVTALEDFTAEDLINEAPELVKPHHNSKTEMDTYSFWTPTVVAPKDNPNASYIMDFDTKAHGTQTKEILTPATCTEDGKLSVVCSLCGDEISYTTIPAHHDFSDNSEFCKVCGEPNPNYSTTAPATTKPDDTTKADDTQATTAEPTSADTSSSADVSNTTNATNVDVTVTTTAPTESTTNANVSSTSVSTTVAPSAVTTTVASQQTTTSVQTTNTQPTAQNVTTTKAKVSKPKSTKIKKLTSKKSAFSITWSKVTGVKGYQIQFATDKKFKKNKKTVNVNKQKTTKKTVKKLKSKKKYYVRIRTYKVSNGKKVYSSWSKTKTVKTK